MFNRRNARHASDRNSYSPYLRPLLAMAASMAVAGAVLFTTACGSAAPCASPARNTDGSYSSYRTAGTMPSGTSVVLADGDTWSCVNGKVTVH
jgi:hypothetical protein